MWEGATRGAQLPAPCVKCSHCARGMTNLARSRRTDHSLGPQLDGTYRFHARAGPRQMCLLGNLLRGHVVPMASVVKVDPDTNLEKAAVIGCSVPTGFGSVTNTAGVRPE